MRWSGALLLLLMALVTLADEAAASRGNKAARGRGSKWWGIAKAGEPNNLLPMRVYGLELDMQHSVHAMLRRKQRRLVQGHSDLLLAVMRGANQAIGECQWQFRHRQWNCSTTNFLRGKNLFGKIVDRGCRETAFIYAITSAGVTHSIARACSEGSIQSCTCDSRHQSRGGAGTAASGGDWEWGGCSDNVEYGFKFSREFVDTGERGRSLREKMNLHNNEAGRRHVREKMYKECKCHGMSGSCTVRTCWMRLPEFRLVGDNLKDRFDGASRVLVSNAGSLRGNNNNHHNNHNSHNNINPNNKNNGGNGRGKGRGLGGRRSRYNFKLEPFNPDHKPPGRMDLVYLEQSPDFCERDPHLGIQGTRGRLCNATSIGMDGCDLMCCGRPFHTEVVRVVKRCKCTFRWCCEVECDLCYFNRTIHTCL